MCYHIIECYFILNSKSLNYIHDNTSSVNLFVYSKVYIYNFIIPTMPC